MANPTEMDRITSLLGRAEAFLVVFLVWVALYLPGLGAIELHGEEGRRLLPALTMLKTGDWLVPHVGGEAYCSKPPFVNWLVAGSFLLTGRQDEFSARLPSALFVLAFVALLVWFGGDWPRVEARLIAAVIFLTSYGVLKKGHQIEIEAVYVSLTAMAVLTWLGLWVRGASRWTLWLVPAVFLTCGMLTKGRPFSFSTTCWWSASSPIPGGCGLCCPSRTFCLWSRVSSCRPLGRTWRPITRPIKVQPRSNSRKRLCV